jgi:putative transposase
VLAENLINDYRAPVRKICSVLSLHRSVWYYKSQRKRDDNALRLRMREIASTRVRYGCRRIHTLLRREGWKDNHKRVHRLYKLEGLNLRSKRPRRHKTGAHREDQIAATRMHQLWCMDFVSDQLFDGRKFRALTIVDIFTRKCLSIHVGQSIKGEDVVNVVEQIRKECANVPERIHVDNGSEFISKALDKWAYENKVTLAFSRPGKPTDNPFIESFNGGFRDECLNVNWFLSLDDASQKITHWRNEYNQFRPHSSLKGATPDEFIERNMKSVFSN